MTTSCSGVAVKPWADTPQARWEVQVLASLKHPHIVEFYDVVIQGGKIHLVMELGLGRELLTTAALPWQN